MEFSVPLRIKVSKNKYFVLNLNQYRNAHHRILSNAKRNYTDMILAMDLPYERFEKARVHYKIYPGSKRKFDGMNVVSIIDKFVCDAIVKRGILPDDNIDHLVGVTWEVAPIDRDNPRAEVIITEV